MKTKFYIFLTLIIMLISCKDKGEPFSNPTNRVVLNMMDEDNGKTQLDDADIYIDRNMNFTRSKNYVFCDYGQATNLYDIEDGDPDMREITTSTPVVPKEGYLAFPLYDSERFPSGCAAIAINKKYYRLWVEKWIDNDASSHVGAVVHAAQYTPRKFNLPDWDSDVAEIDVIIGGKSSTSFKVQNKDCEAMLADGSLNGNIKIERTKSKDSYTEFTFSIENGGLQDVFLRKRFPIYLRVKNSFTMVYIQFNLND